MRASECLQEVLKDPQARKDLNQLLKTTPPRRKVIVIFDRDIPDEFIERFLNTKWLTRMFKILGIAVDALADGDLIKAVQQSGSILITRNVNDFWDDKKFKLKDSPGILILDGNTVNEIMDCFLASLNIIDFVDGTRRFSDYMKGMKIKASKNQVSIKYLDFNSKLQKEEISL